MSSLSPLPDMPLLPITSGPTVTSCRELPVTERDIFVCSYPKSGTTWTQNLVCRLLAANLGMDLPDDWHLSHSAPFYEVDQYWNNSEPNPSKRRVPAKTPLQNDDEATAFRVFNTHLRPHQLPPNAKCVYVVREPLDVLTSFYHHLANQSEADGGYSGTPQECCADFVSGAILYGKWQDHIEAWLGHHNNHTTSNLLLLLHYQDMKHNLNQEATKLARFLGVPEQRLLEVVKTAVPHCSFFSMRAERWRYTPLSVQWKMDDTTGKPYNDFVRAGRMGDGKEFLETYFTDDLRSKWRNDLELAKSRWLQAGVDPVVIQRYLGR